jgi:hypothetical protein
VRHIIPRCRWGLAVLTLVAIIVLSSATVGTTIAAALAPPDAAVPALHHVSPTTPQVGLAIVNPNPH